MAVFSATTNDDELLAQILTEFTESQKRGETPDLEGICQKYPNLATELRGLWATAQFASVFTKPSSSTLAQNSEMTPPPPSTKPLPEIPDYEIIRELGRGGMGVVYLARQKSLNREVSLKIMRDSRLGSESDRARFRAEAASAARLKHPYIVTMYEVGEWQGLPYLVMEYVPGGTLANRLGGKPLLPREAAQLVSQIARGVQHAHDLGVLHRDLKPSNILMEGLATPKISDFGLAKRLTLTPESIPEARTLSGAIVGTPGYLPPEHATGAKESGPASDVYGLGAILYECLTGHPPFRADNPVETLLLVLEQEPTPPRMLAPGVDRDLENICLKCLQKNPKLRYRDAGSLADDLEAYLAGEQISSAQSGLTYFISRMLRETHHASVLENWGLLWIWHSLATFVLCFFTQILEWQGEQSHLTYLALWGVGLVTWGTILWQLRRRASPVLFVERQIAHAWAAGIAASIIMFVIEVLSGLDALTLSPATAVAAGMIFLFKAGILSGQFYLAAFGMFLTAILMTLFKDIRILLFGTTSALCFFIPGLKYYRIRKRSYRQKEIGST